MTLYGTLAPNGDTSICYGPLTLDANAHACKFRETFVNGQCDFRLPVRLLGDGRMSETIASTFSRDALSLTWATPRARAIALKGLTSSALAAMATQGEVQLDPNCDGYWGAESPIASTKVFANLAQSPSW